LDEEFATVKLPGQDKRKVTKRELLEYLKPVVEAAGDHGFLQRSMVYDNLGLEAGATRNGMWDKFNKAGAGMFHVTERLARQVSLLSAFMAHEAKVGKSDPAGAVQFALDETVLANGGAAITTSARVAQRHIGRVAMMYKSFGLSMYYMQYKLVRDALKGETDAVKREALRQLMYTQGSVLTLTGVQGLTITGIITGIIDLMFQDDDELGSSRELQEFLGDTVFFGGMQGLTAAAGAELKLAERIGLSNMLLSSNRFMDQYSGEEKLVNMLGGPAYSSVKRTYEGVNELLLTGESFEDRWRGFEKSLPTAFANILKAGRFADEGVMTRRFDPVVDDIHPLSILGQALGYGPQEVAEAQAKAAELKDISDFLRQKGSKLTKRLYLAKRMGDWEEYEDVMEDIEDFNEKWPQMSITPAKIKRSLQAHERTSAENVFGGAIIPKDDRESIAAALGLDW
jgi:hypothetical protein